MYGGGGMEMVPGVGGSGSEDAGGQLSPRQRATVPTVFWLWGRWLLPPPLTPRAASQDIFAAVPINKGKSLNSTPGSGKTTGKPDCAAR